MSVGEKTKASASDSMGSQQETKLESRELKNKRSRDRQSRKISQNPLIQSRGVSQIHSRAVSSASFLGSTARSLLTIFGLSC